MKDSTWTWVLLGAGVALIGYLKSQPAATPAPLSIYPSLAWTAVTTMAATPAQKATTATAPVPTGYFTSVQQQEQAAVTSQCAGSYPVCTPLAGDTQLGM